MTASRTKKDEIWSGKDYASRTVTLYVQERDHIAEHEEMQLNYTAIYDTIQNPDVVYASKSYPENREVMYKRTNTASYYPLITATVVEYTRGEVDSGHVVTAFSTKKEGANIGQQLYPEK